MTSRAKSELDLLLVWFGDQVTFREDGLWVRIADFAIPSEMWSPRVIEVAFQIPARLPGQAPYGFYAAPRLLRTDGEAVLNYTFPDPSPPFKGEWGKFSWQLPHWRPAADPTAGSNMLEFARSIANRFLDGP